MTRNLLSEETSPYLLQHKDNPVHWQPWGADTLARAQAEDKPIMLSIGYAACHWGHVMDDTSYANPGFDMSYSNPGFGLGTSGYGTSYGNSFGAAGLDMSAFTSLMGNSLFSQSVGYSSGLSGLGLGSLSSSYPGLSTNAFPYELLMQGTPSIPQF